MIGAVQRDWSRVEDAYEVWAEIGDIDRTPTREEASRVSALLREAGHDRRHVPPAYIMRWLTDRRTYSPYVDEVAIERVIRAQSWDSLDGLTDREKHVLLERLVEIVDRQVEFDDQSVLRDDGRHWSGTASRGYDGQDMETGAHAKVIWGTHGRPTGVRMPRLPDRLVFPDRHPLRDAVDTRRARREARVRADAA